MKPTIGISACLLGQAVRHNGSYFRHQWISETLAKHVTFVSLCPEMAMGLASPRESMRLVKRENGQIALIGGKSGTDFTATGLSVAKSMALLHGPAFDALILAPKSPSCGLERVRIYEGLHNFKTDGQGLFAQEFQKACPDTPIINAGRLFEQESRRNFLITVYTLARFKNQVKGRASLQRFHRSHKFLLSQFSIALTKKLGLIAAGQSISDLEEYRQTLVSLFQKTPSRANQVNVLEHLFGFLKKFRPQEHTAHILSLIAKFRAGEVSIDFLLQLLKFENALHKISYLEEQYIFEPFPNALAI